MFRCCYRYPHHTVVAFSYYKFADQFGKIFHHPPRNYQAGAGALGSSIENYILLKIERNNVALELVSKSVG